MLFADATPDPKALYQALVIIQFLGGLFLMGAQGFMMFRANKAQERNISWKFEPASKKEFEEHVKANDAEFEKIGDDFKRAAAEASERRRVMYGKLDETRETLVKQVVAVSTHVAALEATASLTNQRTILIEQKLDRAIERAHDR